LLALANNEMVRSELSSTRNFSQSPTVVRLAASGAAPPASAVTNLPLAFERRATNPLPASTRSNSSQSPLALRLATSGLVLPLVVTNREFARDSRLTVGVFGAVPTCSSRSGEPAPALFTVRGVAAATIAART